MRGPSTKSPDLLVTLNLLPRPLLEISSQELPTRLLHKTSMRNLGTKSPEMCGLCVLVATNDLGNGFWDVLRGPCELDFNQSDTKHENECELKSNTIITKETETSIKPHLKADYAVGS